MANGATSPFKEAGTPTTVLVSDVISLRASSLWLFFPLPRTVAQVEPLVCRDQSLLARLMLFTICWDWN